MELAKNHRLDDSSMCLKHVFRYYESDEFGGGSITAQSATPRVYGIHEQPKKVSEVVVVEGGGSPVKKIAKSNSSSLSASPTSSNSSGLAHSALKHQSEEGNSVYSFKAGYGNFQHSTGSLLSFEQTEQFHQHTYSGMSNQEDFSIWEDNMHHNNQNHQLNSNCSSNYPNNITQLLESPSKIGGSSPRSHVSAKNGTQFVWISPDSTAPASGTKDLGGEEESLSNKRSCLLEENTHQPQKKQCISPSSSKQLKPKTSPSKDPQSIAAKNRREKISERLKTLQELVPNGSKVDLVTMLEKAISYVKFLQLQVKVLATDEFWPAQGGKAPELSQVKDAIDAILASQRDRNSTSDLPAIIQGQK